MISYSNHGNNPHGCNYQVPREELQVVALLPGRGGQGTRGEVQVWESGTLRILYVG